MENKGLKLAISGKGGVGKTTLAALLAHVFSTQGKKVIAVDADPDANLGIGLGLPRNLLANITPISQNKKLVKERTGAEPGVTGQIFTLNPQVADIPTKYTVEHQNIRLLQMGNINKGGSGCACPENTLLKQLLKHLVLNEDDVVIVDMEAGLEHLGRGTAESVDAFLVVVEPGQRSIQTAKNIGNLAKDLGVNNVLAVTNKVRPGDEQFFADNLNLTKIGSINYDESIIKADLNGENVWHNNRQLLDVGLDIYNKLNKHLNKK